MDKSNASVSAGESACLESPECGPNRQLPFSRDTTGYQQTRDVGTRNEQHHEDSSKQDPSYQARTLHLAVAQGANLKMKILAKVRRYQLLRIGE